MRVNLLVMLVMAQARRRVARGALVLGVASLAAIACGACSTATKSSNVRVPPQLEAASPSALLTQEQLLRKTELAIRREGRWLDGVDAASANVFSGGESRGTISEIRADVLEGKFPAELVGRTLRPQFASLLACYESVRVDNPGLPPASATVRLSFDARGSVFSAEVRSPDALHSVRECLLAVCDGVRFIVPGMVPGTLPGSVPRAKVTVEYAIELRPPARSSVNDDSTAPGATLGAAGSGSEKVPSTPTTATPSNTTKPNVTPPNVTPPKVVIPQTPVEAPVPEDPPDPPENPPADD